MSCNNGHTGDFNKYLCFKKKAAQEEIDYLVIKSLNLWTINQNR